MADALQDMAAAAVAASPALQTRVGEFVDEILDEAMYMVQNGTPKMKADLINKLVPHLVRQLADKAEDDEVKAMRAEMNELRQGMQRGIGVGREVRPEEIEGSEEEMTARAKILSLIPKDRPGKQTISKATPAGSGGVKVGRRSST